MQTKITICHQKYIYTLFKSALLKNFREFSNIIFLIN